jgi:hypothetical protein
VGREAKATDEWGRRVSGSSRMRGVGHRWAEGGGRERGREKAAAGVGWNRPNYGERKVSPFLFIFQFLFLFLYPFLLNN